MGLYTVFQMMCCLLSLLWALVVNMAALLAATARMLLRGDLLGAGGGAPLESNDQCAFYEGKVHHVRRKPVHHEFTYPTRYVLLDLDNPPAWFDPTKGEGHLSPDEARALASTDGAVKLLTLPVSAGYAQNPISVYYCYNKPDPAAAQAEPELVRCIAEVTNTPWGERVTFPFTPEGYTVPKSLHVSPMMDMQGIWRLVAKPPGRKFTLSVSVQHPEYGAFFSALLTLERKPQVGTSLERWLLMRPHLVLVWIYWNAVLLLWKGVTFFDHPRDVGATTTGYRDTAKAKLQEMHPDGVVPGPNGAPKGSRGGCPAGFMWREAKGFPWR